MSTRRRLPLSSYVLLGDSRTPRYRERLWLCAALNMIMSGDVPWEGLVAFQRRFPRTRPLDYPRNTAEFVVITMFMHHLRAMHEDEPDVDVIVMSIAAHLFDQHPVHSELRRLIEVGFTRAQTRLLPTPLTH